MINSVVIDISAFIWHEEEFNINPYPFWSFIKQKIQLLDLFKKFSHRISIYLRDELLSQIWTSFPYKKSPNSTKDINLRISLFLMNTNFQDYEVNAKQITSEPIQDKEYFSKELKVELKNLLNIMHNSESVTYFSFQAIYEGSKDLQTISTNERIHKTYIIGDVYSVIDIQDSFFPKFEHYPEKHDPSNPKAFGSPLRCVKGNDLEIPQSLLNSAIYHNDIYFEYDKTNSSWIIFRNHADNLYHGYEESDLNKIPNSVQRQRPKSE